MDIAGRIVVTVILLQGDSASEFRKASPSTYAQATKACRDGLGEQWTLPSADLPPEKLRGVMSSNGLSSAWMGVERKLEEWTWVNGTKNSDFIPTNPNYHCAAFDVNEQKLIAAPCADQSFGFLCELPVGTDCPFMHFKQACFSLGETRGILGCRSKNWFQARSYCLEAKGDLAIPDRRKNEAVSKLVADRRIIADCPYVYIGLRRESWQAIQPNGSADLLTNHYWSDNEPRNIPNADCAQVTREGMWKVASCSTPTAVLCQNYGIQESTTVKIESKGGNTWSLVAIIAIVVAILLATAVIILAVVLRIKIVRSSKQKYSRIAKEEELSNMHMERLTLPNIPKEDDCTTVILFNHMNSRDSTTSHVGHESKEDTTEPKWIGPWDTKPVEKTVQDVLFRVWHINVSSPTLSKQQSEEVLNHFISEKESIDILYLPGMELNEKSVSLVQELRESVALFCLAKTGCTGDISRETITIGFTETEYKRRHPDIIANGLLDFTCNTPEKSFDKNIDPRVAHTLMLAAKRMWIQKSNRHHSSNVTADMRHYLIDIARKKGSEAGQHPYRGFGELPVEELNPTTTVQDTAELSDSEPPSDEETYENKSEKAKEPRKIVIAMGSTGVNTTKTRLKGWDIKPFEESRTNDEDSSYYTGTCVAELLTYSLKQYGISPSQVLIYDVHVLKDAWKDDWPHFEQLLNRLKEKKPDIVYIASGLGHPENDSPIPQLIHDVKQQSVFLTSSVLKDPSKDVYPDFPSDSVISVRVDKDPYKAPPGAYARGATVDFAMKGPPTIHSDRVWNGGVRATALVAKILIESRSVEAAPVTLQKQLRRTDLMHQILVQLSEDSKSHDDICILPSEQGAKKKVENSSNLSQCISAANSAKKYWAGKNV